MDLRQYVTKNQEVIDFVRDVTPGHIDRYTGTLDYATARFNTILLKLSQDPLKADQHKDDLDECLEIIRDFHQNTLRMLNWPWALRPFVKVILHYKGKIHIPKIKFLLDKINN